MNEPESCKEVNLYYITSPFEILLSKLCVQLINKGLKLLVLTNSKHEKDSLDQFLWINVNNSFIPHRQDIDPYFEDEKIILLNGDYQNYKNYNRFDILLVSPSVQINKLEIYKKFFIFSNKFSDCDYINHKNKLQKSGFTVKTLIEMQNQKWKVN
ncbi:DNA polymerase III subunit chi [Rickettsiales bacterium]|nr:DNA polymerase III subunit chi [Rickettsiales bacterium]